MRYLYSEDRDDKTNLVIGRFIDLARTDAGLKTDVKSESKCPFCGSTNIRKISAASVDAGIAAFGLFGVKRDETFHCNDCGHRWR